MKNKCARVRLVMTGEKVTAYAQTRSARGSLAYRGSVTRIPGEATREAMKRAAVAAIMELLEG